MICNGITLSGKRCNRKVKDGCEFCYQHINVYRQTKPSTCIICYEPLTDVLKPLICGHWIHTECIIQSGKAQCPICRKELELKNRDMRRLERIARERREELIAEEQEELRRNLDENIPPVLRERIEELVQKILEETADDDGVLYGILTFDILMD